MFRFRSAVLCVLSAILLLALVKGHAQNVPQHANAAGSKTSDIASLTAAPALTQRDLEALLDGLLPYALANGEIAGAVVVVVKDNQVLLEKGYGYSDLERKTSVDPERTLFRFGSVSKLFTWTAVMQMVEQGKIDLDRDVNDYLDFQIPPAFGKSITMRNLMTHTAGFEERVRGMEFSGPDTLLPLRSFVRTVPKRIFPPGEIAAYSNDGAALAGYIVQRVSGEDFLDYLDHHIFQPLGMRHATFRQPLSQLLAPDMSKGYKTSLEPATRFEICGPIPAGALSATGADMARFMIAHLKEDGGGLLRPDTAHLMHTSIFRVLPPLEGMTLGFFETSRNGRRVISHSGDTVVFHSDMELLLDEHIGLLISLNSSGKDGAAYKTITAFFEQFMDRYFPAPAPQEPTTATAREDGELLARIGRFQDTRRADSNFISLFSLFDQQSISVNPDGTIILPSATGVNGQPKVWHEVAPYVWREVNGKERLAASFKDGRVFLLGTDSSASSEPLQPVPRWKSASWNVPLLIAAAGVLLLTCILWLVAAIVRRHFAASLALSHRELLAYRSAHIAAVTWLLFLLGWLLIFDAGFSNFALLSGPLDPWIRLVQLVGLFALVGTVLAIWNASVTVRATRPLWAKVASLLLATACFSLAWFALAFHLIFSTLQY
ncbi:MAG: serine hydrolase domain-containing protein [Candidatus Acidiferrum sp.]